MKITLKEFIPRSWWHPIGAYILCKEFSLRTPNLCNTVTITFTIDRTKFKTPLDAWVAGVLRTSDFMEAFRAKYGPTEYFIGLEFQREDADGEAWPHWHAILLRRGTYDKKWITQQWGYGWTDVRRIRDKTLDYFLKYVTKCYDAVPDWVLPLNRIRRVRYSRHFLQAVVKAEVAATGMKSGPRVQRTIGERLDDWASRATIKCGEKVRSAQTRQPWKQLLRKEIGTILKLQAYEGFGVLAVETTNQEQLLWTYQNLIVYRNLSKSETDSSCVACFSPPRRSERPSPPKASAPPRTTCASSMRFTAKPA
ncbi:MAG TPA: hypothetical protein VK737_02690, partial [Opitutales bacterium]|nr:hypothetical protein [Opitutales bacterium]